MVSLLKHSCSVILCHSSISTIPAMGAVQTEADRYGWKCRLGTVSDAKNIVHLPGE